MGYYMMYRRGDGDVYLQHAEPGFQANAERPGHKYILRIVNALGTRYFYTKEQIQAYYNKQKDKVQQTAQNAATAVQNKVNDVKKNPGNDAMKVLNGRHMGSLGSNSGKQQESSKGISDQQQNSRKTEKNKKNANMVTTASGNTYDTTPNAGHVVDVSPQHQKPKKDDPTHVVDASPQHQKPKEDDPDHTVVVETKGDKLIKDIKETVNKVFNKQEEPKNVVESARSRGQADRKVEFGRYEENDPDFDYDKQTRIGDTDFWVYKRKDGTSVVVEEDMKWVLPKGVEANSKAVAKALGQFRNRETSGKIIGKEDYTNADWVEAVTNELNKAVKLNTKPEDILDNSRPEGRKRNVTGTADPIEKKEAPDVGPVSPYHPKAEQTSESERGKKNDSGMPTADQNHNYVQDRIDSLNSQIVDYNAGLDKLEEQGYGLKDKETQDFLKQSIPKMVGNAAASYILTNTEREQADQGMKESYESIQKDLQSIQNDPNASEQAKKYARKVEEDLKDYQEAVDTYNMLCDKNPGGMSKRAQQRMQRELEKKQETLIKDGEYRKSDADWATDSIRASLDAYKKVSNSSMYTRDEMMSYGGLIESMLQTWLNSGLTQEDWDKNFNLKAG